MRLKKIPPAPSRTGRYVFTDDTKLLDFAIRIAAIAFLIDDCLEFRTFIRDLHILLPSPILPIVNTLPPWTDWASLTLHIGGLVFLIWRPRLQDAAVAVLAVTTLCVLGDLIHLQPFTMMYGFTILMAALPRVSEEKRLQALRIMIVGVYFWAGFNKLNTAFYFKAFPAFISPFWGYPEDHAFINFIIFGASLFVPVAELSIGIFLLFERLRLLATIMAGCMLIVVLACLGPFGHNGAAIVWPWNIYLFVMEFCLFLMPHENCLMLLKDSWLAGIAAAIFVTAPILGIWNLLDAGPSFKLYAGNTVEAYVFLDSRENLARLPEEIRQAIGPNDQGYDDKTTHPVNERRFIRVYDWLTPHITATTYISDYAFRTGAKALCSYLQYPATATLEFEKPDEFNSMNVHTTDEPLCLSSTQHSR